MAGKKVILNLFIYVVLVYGVIGEKIFLQEKNSSEQLKTKHKMPVKTVTTEHGDVYDCIDFFEQPAFDHPLLKNHDYHFDMKPSSVPKQIMENEMDKMEEIFQLKRVECPRATVPIRRTNKKNFIKEKSSHLDSQTKDDSPLIYYAGTTTKDGIDKIYGAATTMSIENPSVFNVNQYSSSILSIGSGSEFLHVGWTINPKLYGDYYTRYYIWMHGANESCYNTNCPGFIIVNTDLPLDHILMNASQKGGPRYEMRAHIFQDKQTGNWWLVGHNNKPIGLWPKQLFNTLSDGANKVYFGGVVAVPPGDTSFAQMGTANRPKKDKIPGNAFSRHMTIVNEDNKEEYAADKSDILETLSERYVSRNYHMHWYNRKQYWASTILFGGQ